jgi:hypothetical protein
LIYTGEFDTIGDDTDGELEPTAVVCDYVTGTLNKTHVKVVINFVCARLYGDYEFRDDIAVFY